MQMCAGIDYSFTCPAICVHPMRPIKNFDDCLVFFYTAQTKYNSTFHKNIHGMIHQPYHSEQERFDNISQWAISILEKLKVSKVALEGYSMGSKGKIFEIGENTGLLKHRLYESGIQFITPAPTTIKKHFQGKGNAKKEQMLDAFNERFDLDLKTIMAYNRTKIESPIGDVVDSVAITDYLISNA